MFVTSATKRPTQPVPIDGNDPAQEVSVTAQIPLTSLIPPPDLEVRFVALCQLLIAKGVVTELELTEMLKKLEGRPGV
jgi:hypothetical protein